MSQPTPIQQTSPRRNDERIERMTRDPVQFFADARRQAEAAAERAALAQRAGRRR